MRATVRVRYCSLDRLSTSDIRIPELGHMDVLVRVRAASVNPADLYSVSGFPLVSRAFTGLLRPKSPLLGTDFAGTVEAVGRDVRAFKPGDDVFGATRGAFAEYVAVSAGVAQKPAGVSFEEAAAVPVAGLTALQALRDHGDVQPGKRVLINGASGGVGTYAVQIAVALGAEVTAVCSTPNVDSARGNGAAHVIDYRRKTSQPATHAMTFSSTSPERALGRPQARARAQRDCRRHRVAAWRTDPGPGIAQHPAEGWIQAKQPNRRVLRGKDQRRRSRSAGGTPGRRFAPRPLIQARYDDLDQVPDALRCLATGHARGKIVVTVPPSVD